MPSKAPPPSTTAIAAAVDAPFRPTPGGQRITFNLQDANLAELVNHVSRLTGRRFIYGAHVREIGVSVVSPTQVTLAEAYEAFLAVLQINGLALVPQGKFLKIIDSADAVRSALPLAAPGDGVPDTAAYVTQLHRLTHVSAGVVAGLLDKFRSKDGDITVYEPSGLLLLTDTGANVRRLLRLIEEVDVGSAQTRMWIEPIHYGAATDYAQRINELFPLAAGNGGDLLRVLAEEQTNSLIIVGVEAGYLRLLELLKRLDTAPAATGGVHVLPLQSAVAEELAQTLTRMLSGAAPSSAPRAGAGESVGAGLFEGSVRVTADKATNSLVVTASKRDYAQLRSLIEHLDAPRRQVFLDAVIMDLRTRVSSNLGLAWHGGASTALGGGADSLVVGGFNALETVLGTTELQALALGIRGQDLRGSEGQFAALGPGASIPAFGVALNALAFNANSNVLSTPHIIAMDNMEAVIDVGENVPLQESSGSNGADLAPLLGGAFAGQALQGLGALGGAAPRQDIGTRIKITPHINDQNQVRLEIEEEISERGPDGPQGALGAISITQSSARTTVMVDDRQTVVIGGLMRNVQATEQTKLPILGDLPVIGALFRNTRKLASKTNLLLILTPYVINSQEDLRRVFSRKMEERQQLLDRYFVFTSEWEPPRDYSRSNGLVEEIRQALAAAHATSELELEQTRPEQKTHVPGEPLDLPVKIHAAPAGASPSAPAPRR
jgi:general secretion pathway protein D